MEQFKVSKWGNSLAIRIPAKLAKEMGLNAGDYVSRDILALRRRPAKLSQEEAMAAIREARKLFPKELKPDDWKIDRNDPDMRG